MPMTFPECYRMVRLHAPVAPLFLCREWVNEAWKDLASRRSWSFLRGELTLRTLASRTVTVDLVQDDVNVISTAAFVPTDAGRQFRIGRGPIYTIQTFGNVNAIALDRPYAEPSSLQATATILDAYATMPADFGRFSVIVDRAYQRRICFWLTEDQLVAADPDRSTTDGNPRALVAATPSTYTPTLGQIRYEYWPLPSAAQTYQAIYHKQADRLIDTDVFTGVLADGGEVLITGALAKAAEWPGTPDLKNPYFNLPLADRKKAAFEIGVQRLMLKDDNHYRDDLDHPDGPIDQSAGLSGRDTTLRASDATLAAFY